MTDTYIYYASVIIVGLMSAARLTRLLTEDDWPPVVWFRIKWDDFTHAGPWSKVVHCPWCAAPYITAAVMAWGLLSQFHWTWWLFNGWLAASYVVSWLVFHDEDGFMSQRIEQED